jgi:ABC-2 type transport system permease protein
MMERLFGKMGLIIQKEYLGRVRTRAFVLGTVLGPVGIALLMFGPSMLAKRTGVGHQTVAIVDTNGGDVVSAIESTVATMRTAAESQDESFPLTVVREELSRFGGNLETARDSLDARVRAEKLDGYVILDPDFLDNGKATYYGEKASGVIGVETLEHVLDQVVQRDRMRKAGVDAADLASILKGADLDVRSLGDEEGPSSLKGRLMAGITLIMMLYFMMIFYGQFTMQAVIEDKSSRVVEVMLASVTPTELMAGKFLGQGLVGFTQFGVWTTAAVIFTRIGGSISGVDFNLNVISPDLWIYFGIFFVFGYLLYSLLYAAVGALCSSPQDAQQFQGFITIMIVLPMLLLQVALQNPDGGLATGLSLFPMFTPILMFIRVVVSKPPFWQVGLGIALMIASTVIAFRFTGKLFRLSILHFGKAPSWREIVSLLRSPE